MPTFACTVCGDEFNVGQAALDKYPNWSPKYCRAHSPAKKKKAAPAKRGSGKRARTEENLTLAEVLEKYTGGPQDGVFTDGSAVPNPGRGGWGLVWVDAGEVRQQRYGKDDDTTNNRMELTALIRSVSAPSRNSGRNHPHRQPPVCRHDHEVGAQLGARRLEEEERPDQEPRACARTLAPVPSAPRLRAPVDRSALGQPLERIR